MAHRRWSQRQRRCRRQRQPDQKLDWLCRVCVCKAEQLTYAAMVNKAGKIVQPTVAAFQAAAANADWANAGGYYLILTDQPGEASWPVTAATFILMRKEPTDKAASAEAIKFFKWAFANGDKIAEDLDYIPMPEPVAKLIEKTWSADIKR